VIAGGQARDPRLVAREAYHRDGVICLKPEWLPDQSDRDHLRRIADKTFGERRVAG
jgi:hypothetical protein